MKNKYLFGGVIIVVFFFIMGVLFTQTDIKYENDFSKITKSKNTIKATGAWVKSKNFEVDKTNNIFSFYLVDNFGKEIKVVYNGTIPNNFESCTSVVVTGKYKNGQFVATDILTKCPSKYESQMPDKQS
ncbi:MAG TPA: cytochrome c maturation protein CcmE [Melioribacteraceae bacterium]|nr:cytochrome c maturation protein CcmE [Melioribacteraceae bacterium]